MNKMPLVIFNYNQHQDNPNDDPLDNFRMKIKLPRYSLGKAWKLVSVQALYYSDLKNNFQSFEFSIPELMGAENVMFVNEGVKTEPLSNCFRYYNNNQMVGVRSSEREYAAHGVVSEFPDLNLGLHKGDSEELNLIASARVGNGDRVVCTLNSFSIILEYEE